MLSFFRRALKSWVVVLVLGMVAVAVVVSGVGTPNGLGGGSVGAAGETLATMRGGTLGTTEATRRIQATLAQAQAQQPGLDMAAFVRAGGVEDTVKRLISAQAVEAWGRKHGFTASKKLVDGEIASVPAFRGPTGRFDDATFRQLLSRERLSEQQLRTDIAGDLIRRQVLGPIAGGTRATDALVTPYAAMLLERRDGTVGLVPTAAMPAGPAPTQAAINAYYTANLAAYSLPERRTIRYAAIGAAQVPAAVPPTEAEIAAAYAAAADRYAARETRTLSQVLLPDEAAARALVAKIRAGTPFAAAAAAQGVGFAPADTALGAKTRAEYTEIASPAVSAVVFAAADGATTDPTKSPLGWHVVHIDRITRTPQVPLAQARPALVAELTRRKADSALADYVARLEDAIADGSTFEQVATANRLAIVTTPPVLPDGRAPTAPAFTPSPVLRPLLKAAFQAGEDDDPTVETLGPNSYALLDVADVVAAAPLPLAQVRGAVVQRLTADAAAARARAVADTIVRKVSDGMSMAQAFATAGVTLPAPQSGGGRQIDLARAQGQVPPALTALFTMAPGKVRTVADPSGWFVVRLDSVMPGDIKTQPQLVASTRDQFGRVLGSEYADQFITAIMQEMDVKQDPAAIARFKASLLQGTVTQ